MTATEIEFRRTGAVATITINRPEKLNALTEQMYDSISDQLRAIDDDPAITVGVVVGTGERAFSTGADLSQIESVNRDRPPWQPSRFDSGLVIRKPLIAAIEGYCVAGGLELALFCDFRVAGTSAKFGVPEVKRGLIAGYAAHALPRAVGLSNAMYLLTTGSFVAADEARRIGLVQEVVDDGGAYSRAMSLAEELSGNNSLALQLTKEIALRSFDAPTLDVLRQAADLHRQLAGSMDHVDIRPGIASSSEVDPG